jgi:hypothetical protein
MQFRAQRILVAIAAAALVAAVGAATPASAQAKSKSKSIKTEAEWISFDAEANTVTVKVKKPGDGEPAKALQKNKPASFQVKPDGSVLTRTTVTINGKKAELVDIDEGKTVNIYWRPDEKNAAARFARKIDVFLSDEELEAKYGSE